MSGMPDCEFGDFFEQPSVKKAVVIKNTTDVQRIKLEKLMQNPTKPIIIPEKPKERGMPPVPEFVRNVMGSSAGAGSGEFHVYRHLRRKEYARQKFMKEKGERERLEEEYHNKLEENRRIAEEKTSKKRAKRLRKKAKLKDAKKIKIEKKLSSSEEPSDSESDTREETEKISKDENCQERSETSKTEHVEDCQLEKTEVTDSITTEND